jgi:hypothetical protein
MQVTNDDFDEGPPHRGAETADRPTRPSRPRMTAAPPRLVPRPSIPFCFVPAVVERAVDAARPHAGASARLVASGGPSVVAMAREEDVARLAVGLLLEAAAALPRGARGAEIRIAAYADGDTAVIEVTTRLEPTDAWMRSAHRAAFADERLGPTAWRDLAACLGLRLELDLEEAPTLRLYLPLAAR